MKSCFLLFEPVVIGHHFEFLAYLIRYANEAGVTKSLAIVAREDFRARYLEYFPASDLDPERYKLLKFLDADELAWLQDPSLPVLKRHRRSYGYMHQIATEVGATHIHADAFNLLQLFTWRKRPALPTLSCIFYGPFTRMESHGGLRARFLHRLSLIRRKLFFWASMRSGRYSSVFLLNDEWSVKQLNTDFKVDCCKHLPDPVWDSAFFEAGVAPPLVENSRKRVLFFGTIREDKGSLLFLRALRRLPRKYHKQLSVVYSGAVSSAERKKFIYEFEKTEAEASCLQIEFRDGYADYNDAAELYRSSDLIVIPYIRADRSSGVLNNAVLFGKEVLASGHGLIGSLVEEFQLGSRVAPLNEDTIAGELIQWLHRSKPLTDVEARARFLADHSPQSYAATIFKNISVNDGL